MYIAKDNGRARWELFDPQSAPHMMERLELEGDPWRAIEHDELVVLFQETGVDPTCARGA